VKIQWLEELYAGQILKLRDAENQQAMVLQLLANAASSEVLRKTLEIHLQQTRIQIERLDEIAATLDNGWDETRSTVMQAIMAEANGFLDSSLDPEVLDTALIDTMQAAESYEIASYGSASKMALLLDRPHDAGLLERSLVEEEAMDDKLFALSLAWTGEIAGQEVRQS